MKGTKTTAPNFTKLPFGFRAPQKWRGLKPKAEMYSDHVKDLEHPKNEGD